MNTTCSERTNESTTPARTAGGRARSWSGVMVKDCDSVSPLWAGTSRGNQNPRRLTRTVPSRAVPHAAPMLRKKLTAEVELPMSRRSTAFCTATTTICSVIPMPTPNTTM